MTMTRRLNGSGMRKYPDGQALFFIVSAESFIHQQLLTDKYTCSRLEDSANLQEPADKVRGTFTGAVRVQCCRQPDILRQYTDKEHKKRVCG